MAEIVILGAGIAGLPMATEMRSLARPYDRIVVISSASTLQFIPSNPWLALGLRQRGETELPLLPRMQEQGIDFIAKAARRVHPQSNRVELEDGAMVAYDYLVIATGPRAAFDEIPGTGPGGFAVSLTNAEQAELSGNRWEAFVAAPGPLVVGTVQRASLFIPAYEYALLADAELRRLGVRARAPITFVTAEPYLGHLGLGGVGNSRDYLEAAFRRQDIAWICNARVEEVAQDEVRAVEVDGEGRAQRHHTLPFRHAMLIPAFRGVDAVSGIEGLSNPRGFIVVDKHQRNPSFRNVFAVGACVAHVPVDVTPVPLGMPKSGFMIAPMVTAAAHNIRALLDGVAPAHQATWEANSLADFSAVGAAVKGLRELALGTAGALFASAAEQGVS